jgi:hypothetical protein
VKWLIAAYALVELHGPTGQRIFVNPTMITTIREPLETGHFAKGTHCLVYLSNRNFIAVREHCDIVRIKLQDNPWYAPP